MHQFYTVSLYFDRFLLHTVLMFKFLHYILIYRQNRRLSVSKSVFLGNPSKCQGCRWFPSKIYSSNKSKEAVHLFLGYVSSILMWFPRLIVLILILLWQICLAIVLYLQKQWQVLFLPLKCSQDHDWLPSFKVLSLIAIILGNKVKLTIQGRHGSPTGFA